MSNNKHTQSGKKWGAFWTGFIAFVIILSVLAGVIGWRTGGFKDWTFGFGNPGASVPENPDNQDPDNKDPDGDNSGDNPVYGNIEVSGGAFISESTGHNARLMSAEIPPLCV